MSAFNFQIIPTALEVAGDFDVYDQTVGGTTHYHFNQGETIYFEFKWTQSEWLAAWQIWDSWDRHIYLERIGSGPNPTVPSPDVPFVAGDPHTYSPSSGVARCTLATDNIAPGTFRVTATLCLMYEDPNTHVLKHLPVSGFAEGPIIYIHSAV